MDTTDQNVLDLGALAPEAKQVKLPNGKMVKLRPASMQTLVKLGLVANKLKSVKESDKQDEEKLERMELLNDELQKQIEKIIPEVREFQLAPQQLIGLLNFIQNNNLSSTQQIMDKAGLKPAESEDPSPKAEA